MRRIIQPAIKRMEAGLSPKAQGKSSSRIKSGEIKQSKELGKAHPVRLTDLLLRALHGLTNDPGEGGGGRSEPRGPNKVVGGKPQTKILPKLSTLHIH